MAIPALIQARMTSRRLPGKVLREVRGRPLLRYLLDRLERCRTLSSLVVATSTESSDDPIARFCAEHDIACYRGELNDVLGRLVGAAERIGASAFVRISADSPLIDPRIVDEGVRLFESGDFDIVTNVHPRSFPKGQSVEATSVESLRSVLLDSNDPHDREHVTTHIYDNPAKFRIRNFTHSPDLSDVQLSVDSAEDLEAFASLIGRMTRPHWEYALDDLMALDTDSAIRRARQA